MDELKNAIDDPVLAERWQLACSQFLGCTSRSQSAPCKKARVLLHGLGRGRALLASALDWQQPTIGSDPDSSLCQMRGLLWRYLMSYTGWELMAKSVLWDGTSLRGLQTEPFTPLLNGAPPLKAPFADLNQAPEALRSWMATEEQIETHLPAFLGLSGNHKAFIHWLVGEPTNLSDLQVLASMRHVVAHGTLSPTKALQWGLADLYASAPGIIHHLSEALLKAITPT